MPTDIKIEAKQETDGCFSLKFNSPYLIFYWQGSNLSECLIELGYTVREFEPQGK